MAVDLFCLPCAGGSPRAYRGWISALAPEVTVRPLDLPGRGRAIREEPAGSLAEAAARLIDRLPLYGRYGIAGHSMGGLLGYEMARQICERGLPAPAFVLTAATRPPHLGGAGEFARIAEAGDDVMLDLLADLGMVDPAARRSPMRAMFVPGLRADLAMVAGYRPEPAELPVDLVAWYGLADPAAPEAEVCEWNRYTDAGFRLAAFEGGHYFLHEQLPAVAAELRAQLKVH